MLTPSVTREKQHPQSLRSRRRRKRGTTNRRYWTLKWDLSLPQFLKPTVGWDPTATAFSNAWLAEKLPEKNEEPYQMIRTLLSFEILRSVHTCVRGSRTPFDKIPQARISLTTAA